MAFPDGPPTLDAVRAALEVLPGPDAADGGTEPVFVLACGWRSGSTLVQRVLMTDPDLVVWGEPLGRLSPIARLTELVAGFGASPPPRSFTDLGVLDDGDPSRAWVANLFPGGEQLRRGLRAWLDTWLGAPAVAAGRSRWGLKEVRLGSPDALVLRWLYPDARFVVLVRDPADCWRSLREVAAAWDLYDRFPDRPVRDAGTFGELWDRLATGWEATLPQLDVLRLRYEDLDEDTLGDLGRDLGLNVDPARALAAHVGGTARGEDLPAEEARAISERTRHGRAAWGYATAGTAA